MIIYESTKDGFLRDTNNREIDEVVAERYRTLVGHSVAAAELRAWRESLGAMARLLSDDEIPLDAGIAVEYHIPQTAKRLDVLITGYGDGGAKNAIVVELKQWQSATATQKDAIISTFLGGAIRETVHPSYQAWSYAELLKGFNEAVYEGAISVWPCAYLHNYLRDGQIDATQYRSYTARAPVFLKGEQERTALRSYIKKRIRKGDDRRVLFDIEGGRIRPSKALADSIVSLLKGNREFVLVDDQKSVYEAAKAAALESRVNDPRVVIVEGGPGTGKSVVAINLLVELLSRRMHGKYVSKNAAPRRVYEAKLTGQRTASRYRSLFVGTWGFVNALPDSHQFLIVDEAHRLNEKSGLYGNEGEHQIKEIISATPCAIFFVDEDQRVTLRDVGTKQRIREFAVERGARVEEYELSSQFRCSGSDGYLAWLDDALGIRETANTTLSSADFDFRVFESPDDLHRAIEEKNGDNRARVVAGYCWPWNSKKNPTAIDIEIGESYRRRWNLDKDGSLWIIAPSSISEVGCIHTCQGLEVEYIGVIIGPDLVIRDGRIVTVPEARAKQDQSIRGYKTALRKDPDGVRSAVDIVIKNTYRTLMTRGMKGCYVYCTDPALASRLRGRVVAPRKECSLADVRQAD